MKVPILTYHSLDDSGAVIATAPATFRRQMEHLHTAGYRVLGLGELIAARAEGRALPAKSVALTFDDGYQNFYTEAFPILQEHGFTATVFLITDFCGRRSDWPGQPAGITPAPLLSWAEIKELHRAGIEFGSHTATHPDLTRIPPEQAATEMQRSQATLAERLGAPTTTFAYPYGHYNARVRELARAEFAAACSTKLGKAGPDADPHLLPRVDMYYGANLRIFRALLTQEFDWYLGVRQALREVKAKLQS